MGGSGYEYRYGHGPLFSKHKHLPPRCDSYAGSVECFVTIKNVDSNQHCDASVLQV